MSEFNRENRYIVIKRKDLQAIPIAYRERLVAPLGELQAHIPAREYVVVESDWPEYEQVWRMIEARINGAALAPAAVVMPERKRLADACKGEEEEGFLMWNAALDEVARLNRRAIPAGLLERVIASASNNAERIDRAEAIEELRAILGKDEK